MKGAKAVIDCLSELLAEDLTAADQYFVHSRMYHDWGLYRLYERVAHERDEELEHADRLIRRMLFLEGTPNVAKRGKLSVGKTVLEMLQNDLAFELAVVRKLREAIAVCEQEQDYESRHILREMLAETEEDHTYWLEQQLGLIEKVGLQNYLQSAMGEAPSS
jgi:bacterioferritin